MVKALTLEISDVAKQANVPASTLRYYEEKGLIRSVGRHGLQRVFDGTILEQLDFIALGRKAGFALDEIAAMISKNGAFHINRDQLRQKASDLDQQIKQLTAVRDGLLHAADCRAPSHRECPTFQRLMRLAGKSRSKKHSEVPKPKKSR